MTSEIRTNSLKSRAGLSTVTMTDSGPMFSGITTFVDNSTFSVGTGGTIHAPATNTLNIGVNNTESLRIDSNSNLKVAGIVTATHFHGDGSNLTGISAGTSLSGSTNNTVCTVTGANAIQGEANFTFDGNTATITASSGYALVANGSSNGIGLGSNGAIVFGNQNVAAYATGILDASQFQFKTSGTERFRITSGGQIQLPVNGQQLTWGASQQMKFYYENSEERMYLQGDGAYGFAFRVNGGNRIEISKTTGDVIMQGSGGKNFQWDNSAGDLYLTDSGSGASAKLKIGSGGDLQLYHDVGGANHIVCANNQELKLSANQFSFYDYTGVTQRLRIKPVEIDTYDSLGINVNGGNVNHTNDAVLFAGKTGNADWCIKAQSPGNDYGMYAHTGSGAAYALAAYDGSTFRFRVRGDGTIFASNTTIQSTSDFRLKENIVDANSQWDDIKALRFVNYKWKADSGRADGKTYLGLIAQEVEPISPNLIDIDAQSKEDIDNGVPDPEHKTVKYSIVWMKATKALQEAMTRIETLEQDNIALRARVTNLEGN